MLGMSEALVHESQIGKIVAASTRRQGRCVGAVRLLNGVRVVRAAR